MRIKQAFPDWERVSIKDESHRHIGHQGYKPGGGSHFQVTIVSPSFKNLSRLQRHRHVMAAIEDLFPETIHACRIKALHHEEGR